MRPQIGERFIPYGRFTFLPVPEPVSRCRELPPGAKLVYGRLVRYAGKDGLCWPAVKTLADEVGLGERMVQKHLALLENCGFIERQKHLDGRRQTANLYWFLWHPIFDEWEQKQKREGGVNDNLPSPVNPRSLSQVNFRSHKESHTEESHPEKKPGHAGLRVKLGSPEERQGVGELEPVHSGSPEESQGDQARLRAPKLAQLIAQRREQLKAARQRVSFGNLSSYAPGDE